MCRCTLRNIGATCLQYGDGLRSWDEVNRWRLDLHREFESAFLHTALPDVPDYAEAKSLAVMGAEKDGGGVGMIAIPEQVLNAAAEHPYPLLFATVSGAHLYGFASADSDWDPPRCSCFFPRSRSLDCCRWKRRLK